MTERTQPGEGSGADDGRRAHEGNGVRFDGGGGPEGTLFAAMPDPAVQYERDGGDPQVRTVNASYAEAFDVEQSTSGPLESQLRSDLDAPGGGGDDIGELVAGAADGDHVRTVVRATTPGGEHDYLTRVVPQSDEDGYLVLTDITAQRERTREVVEQRDRLDEFASIVSHDLRNPLEVAMIQLEAARNHGDDAHFEKVDDAHERMERIISDVLTLSRQGQVIDDVGEAVLGTVALDAWNSVSAPDARLRIVDDAVVRADDDRLQELLENLFRNAAAHGGPSVTIELGLTKGGFYVADDGEGIPESDRERVFDGGFSTSSDGTGLGLVIVERIAEAHGWSVAVTEAETGGARFAFSGVDIVT